MKLRLPLLFLGLCLLVRSTSSCCIGRRKKNVNRAPESFELEPPPVYRISQPRLISSTNDIVRHFDTEDAAAVFTIRRPSQPDPSTTPPPTPSGQSKLHLSARPMPFRGNTDYNRYKDEMREKGANIDIPRTPSDSGSKYRSSAAMASDTERSPSFNSAHEYFDRDADQ